MVLTIQDLRDLYATLSLAAHINTHGVAPAGSRQKQLSAPRTGPPRYQRTHTCRDCDDDHPWPERVGFNPKRSEVALEIWRVQKTDEPTPGGTKDDEQSRSPAVRVFPSSHVASRQAYPRLPNVPGLSSAGRAQRDPRLLQAVVGRRHSVIRAASVRSLVRWRQAGVFWCWLKSCVSSALELSEFKPRCRRR